LEKIRRSKIKGHYYFGVVVNDTFKKRSVVVKYGKLKPDGNEGGNVVKKNKGRVEKCLQNK